jgi:hypothetical protein
LSERDEDELGGARKKLAGFLFKKTLMTPEKKKKKKKKKEKKKAFSIFPLLFLTRILYGAACCVDVCRDVRDCSFA